MNGRYEGIAWSAANKQKWVTRQLLRYSYATSGLTAVSSKNQLPSTGSYVPVYPLPKKHTICNRKNKDIGQVTPSGAAPVRAFTVCHVLNT